MALEIGAWFKKLLGKVEQPQEEGKRVGGEMTAKEAGELASAKLSGQIPVVENSQLPTDRSKEEFNRKEQEEPGFWQKPFGKALKTVGIVAGAVAVGVGAMALAGAGTIGMIAGGAVVGLMGLASCTKDPFTDPTYQIDVNTEINQETNITFDSEGIIAAIEALGDDLTANQQEVIRLIRQLIKNQQADHKSLERYLQTIISQLTSMSADNQQFHTNVLEKLEDLKNNQQQLYNDLMTKLDTIISLLEGLGVTIEGGLNTLMNLIAEQGDHFEAGLNSILALLQQISVQVENGNAANQHLLQQIFNKLSELNVNVQSGIAQILAKLNEMDENQQQGVLAILNQIAQMGANLGANQEAILNQLINMDANQQAAFAAIMGRLGEILAAIQAGNVQLDNIAALIEGLDLSIPGVDFSVIITLLQQILAQEQANGNVLNNIQNNQTLIINTTNQLRDLMLQVVTNQEEQKAWLEAIFDKIPTDIAGCQCDCETIIHLLQTIAEYLQNGWNHEGIINDPEFDDILG